MKQQITHTIHNLPAAVEQGIMVGYDGTIGGLGGVTLHGAPLGGSVTICLSGVCDIQAAGSVVAGTGIEIDGSGRAVVLAAGTQVGVALEAGVAPVSGVYALKEIHLWDNKA